VWLALQKYGDVVSIDLDTHGFLERDGASLVRRLLQHRSESKELSDGRFVDYDFLLILVDRSDANGARNEYVSSSAGIAHFVYALPGREFLHLDLAGQHGGLVIIQESKQWDVL
jgi:hypothetical protein